MAAVHGSGDTGSRSAPNMLSERRHMSIASASKRTQLSAPASYYRGGTSRAVIFQRKHLPADRADWAHIFRKVIGSPDPHGRQLDGMGGGVSSLSKICVVEPAADDGVDVDYTFIAIGVRDDEVDYSSNCGNMTSAIGPFAIDSGLLPVQNGQQKTTVRIRNTNTGKIIDVTFPLDEEGKAETYGDFGIDGVAGTAARIELAFLDPAGSKTGKTLPTSSITDTFDNVPATCIDVGNPCVFVLASSLDVPGDLTPDQIDSHPTLLRRLDSIRRQAGVKMGLATDLAKVPGSIPKIAMISPPPSSMYAADVVVRALSVGQPHRAIPITVAMAVAAAARSSGSTVHQACSKQKDPAGITIGHPTGRILVGAKFSEKTSEVAEALVYRTARLLMEGKVFWRP